MFKYWRLVFVLILLICFSIRCSKSTKNEPNNENTGSPPVDFTPKENEEAELIALCLSGELIAPDSLYNQILSDLAAIRAAFGDTFETIDQIRFLPPWVAGCVMIGFDDSTVQQIRNGQYHAWDSLNQQYEVTEIDTSVAFDWIGLVVLSFKGRLHPYRLAEFYSALPGA